MKSEKRQLMKIAVHEAGHAVVSYYLKTPLKYATIVPDKKGRNLGHVRQRLVRFDSDGEFDHMLGESRSTR